jgi:hypothetical protein
MSRSLDKSLGRSFSEIGEILGLTPKQVEHTYVKAMIKLRAENPENGRYLLEQINLAGRDYAKVTSWKPQSGQGEAGGRFEAGIPQLEDPEPAHEELPEEIYE